MFSLRSERVTSIVKIRGVAGMLFQSRRTESDHSNKTDVTELDIQKADCPELGRILLNDQLSC
jgi:hypothetical protein